MPSSFPFRPPSSLLVPLSSFLLYRSSFLFPLLVRTHRHRHSDVPPDGVLFRRRRRRRVGTGVCHLTIVGRAGYPARGQGGQEVPPPVMICCTLRGNHEPVDTCIWNGSIERQNHHLSFKVAPSFCLFDSLFFPNTYSFTMVNKCVHLPPPSISPLHT